MIKDLKTHSDKQVLEVSTQEGYDRWSETYDTNENPLILLEESVLYEDLGDIRGQRFLDLGCGTGRHSLKLASMGAEVAGVDFSSGMLAIAQRKITDQNIRFIKHDLAQPLPFPNESFDGVLCALVLDHVSDLVSLFSEMKRVCKSKGSTFVTVMHPAVLLKGRRANFTDPVSGVEIQPKSVPNQVSDYVLAVQKAGLAIADMKEHCGSQELSRSSRKMKEYLNWPLLLTFRLNAK